MRDIALAIFETEAETYQAFSSLKNSASDAFQIIQMAVVQKEDGRIVGKDAYDSGVETADDTVTGGLIGLLVGILGGPLGVLLGGMTGMGIGALVDADDVDDNSNLLVYISERLAEGETGLVMLVDEVEPYTLDRVLADAGDVHVIRWNAEEVENDLANAEAAAREARRAAKKKLRAQKREERRVRRQQSQE